MIPTQTPLDLARRFLGQHEKAGDTDNPLIVWMLQRVMPWAEHDESAWCAAFVDAICWMTGLPCAGSPRARAWLRVGQPSIVEERETREGIYIAVLSRGEHQPGPDVLVAPGHVGILTGSTATTVRLISGNAGDAVTEADWPRSRVLGVRRLA